MYLAEEEMARMDPEGGGGPSTVAYPDQIGNVLYIDCILTDIVMRFVSKIFYPHLSHDFKDVPKTFGWDMDLSVRIIISKLNLLTHFVVEN